MATDLSFLVEAADRAGAKLEQTLQSFEAVPSGAGHSPAVPAAVSSPTRYRRKAVLKMPAVSAKHNLTTGKAPRPDSDMAAPAYETGPGTGPGTALGNLRELAGITTRRASVRSEAAAPPDASVTKLIG
jgi:hypothetical protein